MAKEGTTIKEIVRSAGYSRGLVRKVLRGQRSDVFRVRSGSLEAYLPWLDEQWAARRCNSSELWREPLVEAREVVADFQAMIRRKVPAELDPWIERAKTSLVAALANGVTKVQSRGERRDIVGLVQRPSRRPDLQTQAGQAPDVWAKKTRSTPSAPHGRNVTSVIKSASEPNFVHAETHDAGDGDRGAGSTPGTSKAAPGHKYTLTCCAA